VFSFDQTDLVQDETICFGCLSPQIDAAHATEQRGEQKLVTRALDGPRCRPGR